MTGANTTPRTPSLLADACRCRSAGRCIVCRRFTRYHIAVQQRRQAQRPRA